MPEGSDAIMEAGDTYEDLIGEIGPELQDRSHLFTILTTAKSYEDIDDLLDLVEQHISFE